MTDPRDDEDVRRMLAFQAGDDGAFTQLYERHRDRVVNYTRRLMGNVADGEEAAQETFIKLYQARARYTPQSRFLTFLFRIATNHCLNVKARHEHKRRAGDGDTVALSSSPTDQQPEAQAQRTELQTALRKALAALPEKQSAAILICHYEGMALQEAAEVLGVSEGAVKQLLHRARATLVQLLLPQQDDALHRKVSQGL